MSYQWDEDVRLAWEAQLVWYNAVAALAFLLWDTMITFADEVQYIWPQSRHSPTKWVFLFTRYFGLLAQARLVSINLALEVGNFSTDVCRMLYVSQVVFGGTLMACIQALLMLRVYALCTQNRRIAFAMIALLVAELGSMPGAIHMTLPDVIGNMCMKPITIRDIVVFGVSAMLPQVIVLGLTLIKFLSGLRAGWGKIPIVSRLVRDDFILVSVIVVWVIITASLTKMNNAYGYVGYNWLLSLLPSVGCRVVINMQRLADDTTRSRYRQPSNRLASTSPQFEFTSLIMETLSESAVFNRQSNHSIVTPSQTHSFMSDPTKSISRDSYAHSHYHVEMPANSYTSYAQSPLCAPRPMVNTLQE
ncbi:hypothetical protein BDN70DRAFT_591086 [Pholiota conissans]|uniref:DUF6533 domain-containing protein n=1 Tax=Pholiota conissans TaxID=109636 RepID=A0A9P6D6E6_9AGAR|nr:hypothetical protein BDN70DRAFT_591086 [Pholiota conissans]